MIWDSLPVKMISVGIYPTFSWNTVGFWKSWNILMAAAKLFCLSRKSGGFPSNIFIAKLAASVKCREGSGSPGAAAGHTCQTRGHISAAFHYCQLLVLLTLWLIGLLSREHWHRVAQHIKPFPFWSKGASRQIASLLQTLFIKHWGIKKKKTQRNKPYSSYLPSIL